MSEQPYKESLLETFIGLFTLPLLIPPGILVWQIYNWLQTAKWKPLAVSDALAYLDIPYPRFQWLGLQKIAEWLLDLPLSLTVFFLWLAVFVVSIAFADEAQRKRKTVASPLR